MMIKGGQAPVFDDPKNYGLDYEDVNYQTKDGVNLSAWLIKPQNSQSIDKVIIQSHFGVQCSRSGFTQQGKGMIKNALWTADIKFLNQAKYLAEAGYAVLMFDMRNHGNSDSSDWITWGVEERKDILASVQYIANTYPQAEIGLLSICMGQGATLFAYGMEEQMQQIPQIKAMISVQPLTYDYMIDAMGMPKFLVNSCNNYNANKRDTDLTGDSFLPYAKEVNIPTLVIQNKNDPMTNLDMVQQYYDDLVVEKELLWLDLDKKRGASYAWLGKNPQPILNWFGKYL